jgi:hypothetical protein
MDDLRGGPWSAQAVETFSERILGHKSASSFWRMALYHHLLGREVYPTEGSYLSN